MSGLIPEINIHKLERVKLNDPDDEKCQTFVFHNEDHTIGNSLRYMIMKNPEVQYCGYSNPHPSEPKINLRIQTHKIAAPDALQKGLLDLQNVCDHVLATFQKSVQEFKDRASEKMKTDSEDDCSDSG
ncbi:DNA-directed RNA polymerases I and III subunit RPAC2 [Hydra vulgaris]|uniref:DNA-directed RNA polymerases I and III subunit RPAC2 n=1 Tax=Hydra vulgaris TaxID=6087 RepID=T2M3D8_HYDVU